MKMKTSLLLRVSLILSIGLVLPGAPVFDAAAQTVPIAISGGGGALVPSAGFSHRDQGGLTRFQPPSLSGGLSLSSSRLMPTFSAGSGLAGGVPAAAAQAAAAEAGAAQAHAPVAAQAASRPSFGPDAARPELGGPDARPAAFDEAAEPSRKEGAQALGTLGTVAGAEARTEKGLAAASLRLEKLYDGKGRALFEDSSPQGPRRGEKPASGLARASAEENTPPSAGAVPSPYAGSTPRAAGPRWSRIAVGAALAAALLLVPGIVLAAGLPAAYGASTALVTMAHPAATAFAAAAGALYGVVSALRREGPPPSAGELMAAALRMGIVSGAGVFVLFDLAQVLFLGAAASALTPLSSALATAALGQSAFQGKFTDPAASPAARIMGAFPAVAAALGLRVGVLMTAQSLLLSLSLGAMSLTGAAAALYSALYRPGLSPAEGPAAMARGYVLQSLMTGLALAVSGPYLAVPFMALAAWGLWDVLGALAREVLSRFTSKA